MFWLRNKKNNFQLHAYLEPRRPDLMYNKHINNYFIKNLLKDKENLAIILVPLIMILSRGHTGQIKG